MSGWLHKVHMAYKRRRDMRRDWPMFRAEHPRDLDAARAIYLIYLLDQSRLPHWVELGRKGSQALIARLR